MVEDHGTSLFLKNELHYKNAKLMSSIKNALL